MNDSTAKQICVQCSKRPRESWLNKRCEYCTNMPMNPDSAIEYENQRKLSHPEEFNDPTPKEIPVKRSGFGNFRDRVESGEVEKNIKPTQKVTTPENNELKTVKPADENQSNLPKKIDSENVFIIVFLTVLGLMFLLRILGLFDSNFKSESEIRIDLYQECEMMNGIDCKKILDM